MRGLVFVCALACAPLPPPTLVHHETRQRATLEQLRGKVVLLNFWATWCAPCVHEIPVLIQLAEETRGRVLVIAVYYQREERGRAAVEQWLALNPAGFTSHIAYGNETVHHDFPHDAIPTTYVLDATGAVVAHVVGALTLERARALVEAAIPRGDREP